LKNLLLTGSSGFIASSFLEKEADKYLIKTFSFQRESLQNLSLKGIDTVLHLAALVHQKDIEDDEIYRKVNYFMTMNLAKKAKEEGVKHFIFMSTVKVYGEVSEKECFTEGSKCSPIDGYGRSKLEAEVALASLENNGFKVSIIRTPIVYGPKVKANILKIVKLLSLFPYLPFANILNRRSMVYIGNLIQLIDIVIQKRPSGVLLASDPDDFSTSEFFTWISQSLHKKTYLFSLPWFSSFLKIVKPKIYQRLYTDLCIDASETQRILDFKPSFTTQEGIDKMIEWYKYDT
jgi:UDP-glucose 4-epimerase